MTSSDDRILLKSAVTHGAQAPVDAIERLGDERTYALMVTATSLAISRKFTRDASLDEISAYAKGLPERFPGGAGEIKPAHAEAVIRALRGEVELLEPLSHDEILGMLFLITYAIMSHERLQGPSLDAYIDQVIATADAG